MNRFVCVVLAILLVSCPVLAAEEQEGEGEVALQTFEQKLSYAMGLEVGFYLKNLGDQVDPDILRKGLDDAYSGAKPLLSAEEAARIHEQFNNKQREKKVQQLAELNEKNSAEAEKFLAENKKEQGVVVTDSGLQYKVITKGSGPVPGENDIVRVHYKGTLLDGTEFDSSYKRKEPAEFELARVVPGWREALSLMHVGSKYRIFLPPELGYGDRGYPPLVEPGTLLIFEVELLAITGGDKGE